MRKLTLALALTVGLVLGGAAGTAVAAHLANGPGGDAEGVAAPVRASAPSARLAALVRPDGTLARKRGVASVTKPETGEFCITPKASTGIDVARVVPQVSVEWGLSIGNANLAQVYANADDCPAGDLEVRTFNGDGASFGEADTVAFTITVP